MRRAVLPTAALVALVGFLFVAVFPTRTWLAQRDAIAAEEARLEVLTDQNGRLAARVQELQTDAELERLAREQYNLVKPGEEAYAILPAPGDPPPAPAAEPDTEAAKPGDPWWRRALHAVLPGD